MRLAASMWARRGDPGGRRPLAVLLAVLLAGALSFAPPAAHTAWAAEPLRTEAHATYTLDPDDGRVHVEIDVTETNLKPNSATVTYYYISFRFALQPEATSIRVSGGSAYRINTKKRDGYIEATAHIGQALTYKNSTSFKIRFELVGGKPRSDSPTRVGAAFSTFGVWAWGDEGRGTVEVRTPAGYQSRFIGDTMQITASPATGQVLRATPAEPASFFSIITAENDEAYAESRLSLDGGVEIVVQSWPEDGPWQKAVTGALRDTMPELRALIGLDWPVEHDLDVRERYTPALEGYAGFFLTEEQRIEVGEDLDPVVIVHEASHAWFNDALFLERWIYEGLAQEYAWRALVAVDGDDGGAAELPDLTDPGFLDLEGWTHPGVIKDQETDDRERYGYQAAFWVIHQFVTAAGEDGMRRAFAGAQANLTAYPGAGAPEIVLGADGWRRLLDLTESPDQPESAAVDQLLRDFVLGSAQEAALADRRAARTAYRDLLERGQGRLPPWYVRRPLGEWNFDDATARMAEATAVLGVRDQVASAAADLGLTPDGALEAAYEAATDTLDTASALARDELGALAAIAEARAKVEATPDLVVQVGLLGETPAVAYATARTAFEAGDLDGAAAAAAAATAVITGAAAVGEQRLILAAVTALVVLLLLALFIVLLRRRGRKRLAPAFGGAPAGFATAPAPVEPYGTLAADPATEPSPPSTGPPDAEGGDERGDPPADPVDLADR